MIGEIYDMNKRLRSVINRIKKSSEINEHNKQLLLKFNFDLLASGKSIARAVFYANRLYNVARWVKDEKLDEMSENEIKDLIVKILQKDEYSKRTKIDYSTAIKGFYVWLDGDARRVSWIRTSLPNGKKLPEELLTKKDIESLIDSAIHVRDKALIMVLYEGGLRISELLNLKLKNVEFDRYGAILIVHGKTGWRRIRLIAAVPYLSNWIMHHPLKNNPESPLWVGIGSRNYGKPLKYDAVRMLLRKIAKRAGLKKRVNPHIFRHSRATELAKYLTEAQLREFFGWTKDSEMPAIYVHLSGRDTDRAILRIYGKLTDEELREEEPIKPKKCIFCGTENPSEAEFCVKCGRPLNIRAAMKKEAEEEKLLRMMSPEVIEALIKKKIMEILSEYGDEIWRLREMKIAKVIDSTP